MTHKIVPQIFMNKDSSISKIVSQMKSLKYYKPTAWLINGHIHTIWGMKFKGRANFSPKKEDINFEDGGQVTIEYFELEKNKRNSTNIIYYSHNGRRLKRTMYKLVSI